MIKRLLFHIIFLVILLISNNTYSQCPINIDSVDNVMCYGDMDGSITVSPSVSGYWTYSLEIWNGISGIWLPFATINTGNNSYTFHNLPSDSFRILVEDTLTTTPSSGCMSSIIFINQPVNMSFDSLNVNDESSLGSCDGSVSVIVSGGVSPYNFDWTGPNGFLSNNLNINNLCAGPYRLVVTDTNGCQSTLNDTIFSPVSCNIDVNIIEHVTCPGGNDGKAIVTNGSTSFQLFTWENLSDSIVYGNGSAISNNNLSSGWYQVKGIDLNGSCPIIYSDSFFIEEPRPYIQTAQSICIGDSIQLSVNIYTPKTGINYYFSIDADTIRYPIGTNSLEFLQIGTHSYSVFADTGSGLINCFNAPYYFEIYGVDSLSINIDSILETCRGNDGVISISSNGGNALSYSIDGANTFFTNPIFTNLSAGNYNIYIQESGGCTQAYINNPVSIGVTPINFTIDSVSNKEESCCGNDGRIKIYTSGSDSVLFYSIDSMFSSQDSAIFDFLSEGSYNISVEDTNGCRINWGYVSIIASAEPNIDMSAHVTDIVCNGDSNGTFRVLFPDSCFTYNLWRYTISPPYYIPIDTGTYFNGLMAGSYGVIAISNSGKCIDSSLALLINEPDILVNNGLTVKEVRCSENDICNGEISLLSAPTGGVPPYYFNIMNNANNFYNGPIPYDSIFSGLCADSFEINIIDANACELTDIVFVPDSSLNIDSIVSNDITCFDSSNGNATIFVSGGYSPYNYMWNNGYSTKYLDSLDNMEYSVIIIDSMNCIVYDSISIYQPDELLFNIKIVDGYKPETCKGVSYDGEFYMNYQGGTAPFSWNWISANGSNGSGFGDTIGGLTYDTVNIFITDANGCVGSPSWIHADSASIDALNSSNPLILDSIYTDSILCYAQSSGKIYIKVLSGESLFSYSIDSGLTFSLDSVFVNLSSGNYNIKVKDNFGCTVSSNIEITESSEITIFNDSIKHVSCYNGIDGYLSISAEGGYAPYSYLWDPTASTNRFTSNLNVGMYSVSVTDTFGCTKVDSISLVELTSPLMSNAITTSNVSCFNLLDGTATINVQGGRMPYDVDWNGVDNSAMAAGVYIITINDSFNCGPIYDTVVILQPQQFLIQTASVSANPCFGDSLGEFIITGNGGTIPYKQFFAMDSTGYINISDSSCIGSLYSSEYFVWTEDSIGCLSDTLKGLKVGSPGEISINIDSHVNPTCFGYEDGKIELSLISGVSPYEYDFFMDGNTIMKGNVGQLNTVSFNNLSASSYLISVKDNNNCIKDTLINIIEQDEVVADFLSDITEGRKTLVIELINNSQGGDLFHWHYGDGTIETLGLGSAIIHSYTKQGKYDIMLVAESSLLGQSCNDTIYQTINVQGFETFNVFSPNNDGFNDFFDFEPWALSSLYVEIYNRWGVRIYHFNSPKTSWNGKTYNDDNAPDGVYYYHLKAIGEDGYKYENRGSVTLLR